MRNFAVLALALLLTSSALFATISRTPIMAFVAIVSLCTLYYLITGSGVQKIALVSAILIFALAASPFVINGTFVERFVNGASSPYNVYAENASSENAVVSSSESADNEMEASDPNMGERRVNYEKALAIVNDNFWSGISPKTYAEVAEEYGLSPNFARHHIHNLFLQIWIESGIFALVLFLSMIMVFFICCVKMRKEPLVLASFGGVLAFLMHNMFDYLFVHGIQFLFGILIAIPFILYYQQEYERSY
jgi:O-antigen ligase